VVGGDTSTKFIPMNIGAQYTSHGLLFFVEHLRGRKDSAKGFGMANNKKNSQ